MVISDDEIKAAHPRTTQTVDIVAFVDARTSPFSTSTRVLPDPGPARGKVCALARDADPDRQVGIANVVLRNKAASGGGDAAGQTLVMNTLRWADEVRGVEYLELKDEALDPDLAERELDMASVWWKTGPEVEA